MNKKTPIGLTLKDWEEIYYALDTKRAMIENGDYGECLEHGVGCGCDQEWITHINNIMDAIGDDGEDAFQRGVIGRALVPDSSAGWIEMLRRGGREGRRQRR